MKKAFLISCAVAVLMNAFVGAQQAPVAGPNVNVMGGPVKWEDPTKPFMSALKQGDPFGQRQDEISCAVDTRNPLVISCAFNDYTPVELPGLLNDAEIGDAWIGRSWSSDGGQTWTNDLLPGYKNDPHGTTSSLWGHDAAADPVWRAAPFGGRSYLAGIAFNRTPSAPGTAGAEFNGVLFVHAYVNNNNIENDPRPVKPDPSVNNGQPVILATPAEGFHDKPWLGIDSLGGVHVVVATFNQDRSASAIWYFVSRDGGKTYSKVKLSNAGQKINNGAMVTVHPWTGWIDVSWRRRASAGQTDAIIFVRSTDGGHSFTSPTVLMSLPDLQRADGSLVSRPFDQGSGQYFFRNISNPAMTTDDKGRVYVAWAERANLLPRDSQIKLIVGNPVGINGGVVWTAPSPIDSLIAPATPATRGHQLRPSMWFAFGKLTLTYMHTREDDLASVFTRRDLPDPGNPAGKIATYTETQEPRGDLAAGHPEKIFNDFIFDIANTAPANVDVAPVFNGPLLRRHSEDVIALMGTPAPLGSTAFPTFAKTKVSRYGVAFRNGRLEQAQFNVLTRALHCGGNCAFAGDYDDVIAQAYVPNILGIGALPNTLPSIAPKFFVAWTDNRDVRPLAEPTRFSRVGPTCSDADATGTRNQNPYLAPVGYGLYLQSFGNQKPLNTKFARAFTIQFQNAVNATKHYRATIANQPLAGSASWLQFSQRTTLDLSIPPFTTASRALFAKSPDSGGAILVNVVEINQPGGSPVSGGLQSSIILNPDRSTPAMAPPVQDPTNPIDPTDPSVAEVYTPDATSPDATSANVLVTPDATSLPATSPDATSPDATSPDATSVPAAFPDATSPDATSPDATSVPSMTPDATSPDATSIGPSDALTDTLYSFVNRSNVAATASIQTFTTKPLCAGCTLQVLVMRPSLSPTQRGCDPKNQDTSVLVANITSPTLITDPNQLGFDATNASPKNLTVAAPPGGRLTVIYRLKDPNAGSNLTFTDSFGRKHSINPTFNPAGDLVPVLTPAALSTPIAQTCGANCPKPTPVIPLSITTAALADGVLGQFYNGESGLQMTATGGVGADAWTASGLPAGMSISPTGRISGRPSAAGTYLVSFTVTDSAPTPHRASRPLSLRILAPDLIVDSLTHLPSAPTTLNLMTFTAVVKNVGNYSAAASTLLFTIGGETPGAAGTLVAIPVLAPGATFTAQRQLTLNVARNYQNTATADYTAAVTESNEGNNSAIDTYTVTQTFQCYTDLPNPVLAFTGTDQYTVDGNAFTRFNLSVTNRGSFPDALFAASPDLPPCGLNTSASRTWANILGPNNQFVYGFCALGTSSDLGQLWFAVPAGTPPPNPVHLTLNDRRCEQTYTSNAVSVVPAGGKLFAATDEDEFDGLPNQLSIMNVIGNDIVANNLVTTTFPLNGMADGGGFLYGGDPGVSDTDSAQLRKFDYTGTIISSTAMIGGPVGCCHEDYAFDGTNMYRAHYPDQINKIDPLTGNVLATYYANSDHPTGPREPIGITFVGSQLWVSRWHAPVDSDFNPDFLKGDVGTWDPGSNTFTHKFYTPTLAGGLAYDAGHGILWVGRFGGCVEPYDLNGNVLGTGDSNCQGAGYQPFGSIEDTIDGLEFVPELNNVALNVNATYVRTNQDPNAVAVQPISLALLGVAPGDTLHLESVGLVNFCFPNFQNGCPTPNPGLVGAFTAGAAPSSTAILPTGLAEYATQPTLFGGLPTDLPGDFRIDGSEGTAVTVPAGATILWVALDDSFFGDNSGTLAVVITKLPN